MKYESAERLKDKLDAWMTNQGFQQSYAKIKHLSSSDTYEVRVVLHPSEESLQSSLPNSVSVAPWQSVDPEGEEYVKRTPRTPSQNTDDYGFYPSGARRRHDGPMYSPDVNPAYPGLRRIPEIQDLVRRVAMNRNIQRRLASVDNVLTQLRKLEKFALAGHGYDKESEYLVSELLDQLKADGNNGRHKVVRLTKKLKEAMQADGYRFQGD